MMALFCLHSRQAIEKGCNHSGRSPSTVGLPLCLTSQQKDAPNSSEEMIGCSLRETSQFMEARLQQFLGKAHGIVSINPVTYSPAILPSPDS